MKQINLSAGWMGLGLSLFAAVGVAAEVPELGDEDALAKARQLLSRTVLIDGHNDLPWAIRKHSAAEGGQDTSYDLRQRTPGQTDIPRLRAGKVGGQFWSVYVPADIGPDLVRVQLEQIDLARRTIERYPETFELTLTAAAIRSAHGRGRIASLLGVEGGHTIDNSLGVLRSYYDLGVRYLTLTHNSHTEWADAATQPPRHGGLTPFGEDVVREMNRLGMLVDLSHTAPSTMHAALRVTRAPVIFSHSAAKALVDVPRNVPDDVLRLLPGNGGIVMVAFVSGFIDAHTAQSYDAIVRGAPAPRSTIDQVADHIEHIRRVAGVRHVGLGADFDGNSLWPDGLEDVSGYPRLFAKLLQRGWSEAELRLLAGENLLRVLEEAEQVAKQMRARPHPSLTPSAVER